MNNLVTLENVEVNEFSFFAHNEISESELNEGRMELQFQVFDHKELLYNKMIQITFNLYSNSQDDSGNPLFSYDSVMNCYIWFQGEWNKEKLDIILLQSLVHLKTHLNTVASSSRLDTSTIDFEEFVKEFKKEKLGFDF